MQLEAGNGAAVDNQGFQTKQSYGDRRFVEIYDVCEHVINKTFQGRLRICEIFAGKYISWAEAADKCGEALAFKSFDEFVKDMENSHYGEPASDYFCQTKDIDLKKYAVGVDEIAYLQSIRDNLNYMGRKLYDAVIKLHAIFENPMDSKTLRFFLANYIVSYRVDQLNNIKKIFVDCYSETRSKIEDFSDFSTLLTAVGGKKNLQGELAEFLKYWFRNTIYSLLKEKFFHISSSHLQKLEGPSKAKIINWDWMSIIDSLDTEEKNSKLDDDITQREGTDVSQDQWNGVEDFYHRQINSPSSIWGGKQEGRILISDSVGKTMRLNKDRTDWEVQDNKFTIAVVSRFLKTK